MQALRLWLQGKKTYLVCITGVLAAATGWVDGGLTTNELVLAVLVALSQMAQRAAMAAATPVPSKE